MKKKNTSAFTLFLVMLFMSCFVSAQIKIGTNPTQIVAGSKLQIDGDNKATTPAKLIVTGNGNVGVGTAAPDASALLDISTTDKGVLIPRVSLTATNVAAPIISPATSLLVYNTATAGTASDKVSPGYYYWDGAKWVQLATTVPNSNWNLLGNAGTNAGTNFIGTTDNIDFVTKTNNTERMRVTAAGNVGIGTTGTPAQTLHVEGTARITGNTGTPASIIGRNAAGDIGNITLGTGLTLAANGTLSANATTSTNIYNTDGTLTGNRTVTQGANTLALTGTAVNAFSVDGTTLSVDAANNRLGIGTSTPNSVLDLGTTVGRKLALWNSAAGTDFYGLGIQPGILQFYTSASATKDPGMVLTAGGNVGVGTATPDASALLDLGATDKGMLIPRVSLTATNVAAPIASPAASLMVYNIATAGTAPNNVSPGYYYWDSAKWVQLLTSSTPSTSWKLLGNAGTNASTNFVGTTDNADFVTRTNNAERMRVTATGNVGIGTSAPQGIVDVVADNVGAGAGNDFHFDGYGSSVAPAIFLGSAEGTAASPSNITAGTQIGLYNFKPRVNGLWAYTSSGMSSFYQGNGINDLSDLRFTTSSAVRAIIDQYGNMGIGTIAPQSRLNVVGIPGSATAVMQIGLSNCGSICQQGIGRNLVLYNENSNGELFGSLNFVPSPDPNQVEGASIVAIERNIANNSAGLDFKTRNTTTNVMDSRLTIRSDGKVGIGTAAPAQKFHVEGTARITGNVGTPTNIMGRDANGDIGNLTLGTGLSITAGTLNAATNTGWNLLGNAGATPGTNFIGTTDNNDFVTRTHNAERMRVTAAGNVGIGTTAPIQRLSVVDVGPDVNQYQGIASIMANNLTAGVGIGYNGIQAIGSNTNNDLYLNGKGTGNILLQAASSATGNVGIGTNAPIAKLSIAGDGTGRPMLSITNTAMPENPTLKIFPGWTSDGGGILPNSNPNAVVFDQDPGINAAKTPNQSLFDFHGQIRAVSTDVLSDIRLKKDIKDLNEYGVATVMKLQPRRYTLKAYNTPDVGLIAQELKKVVPELVNGDENKGLLSIDYAKISLVLINAVKEQQSQIETQKTENSELKKQLAAQQETLSSLLKEVASLKEAISTKK